MTFSQDYLEALAGQLIGAAIRPKVPPKASDRVVLSTLPPWVDQLPEETQRVFRFCVDRSYEIVEVDANGLLVLDVSGDVDELFGGCKNDIRVEPEYVRLVEPATTG